MWNTKDYVQGLFSLAKTYDRIFHKEKYPKLELIQIKIYLQNHKKNLIKF
jgi:hypothetical protein